LTLVDAAAHFGTMQLPKNIQAKNFSCIQKNKGQNLDIVACIECFLSYFQVV